MASLQNTSNYVKFVRGTKTAWESLKASGQIFNDTLYFIYESTASSTGVLYLGAKQIGGADTELKIPAKLADLTDVLIDSNISPNDILIYNGTKWVSGSVNDALSFDSDVFLIDEGGSLALAGFSQASVGTIPQKDTQGSITWVAPGDLTVITDLQAQFDTVYAKTETYNKTEVDNLIASVDHLRYKKVTDYNDIKVDVPGADKYIYLVPTSDVNNSYNEYMVIDGKVEPVGSWSVNLDDYLTQETFYSKVNELNDLIGKNTTDITTINSNLTTINGTLTTLESGISANATNLSTLSTTVNNFMGAVGSLDDLVVYYEGDSLVDHVNHLTQQLIWQEIVE